MSQTPDILGDRQSGQDVRTQNVVACQAVVNIVKSSLGPVGLDKADSLAEKMLEEHSKETGSLHEEEEEDDVIDSDDDEGIRKKVGNNKRKRKEEANDVEGKRGVCYLSRVPPRMEPLNLRRILSRFGDIQRIYLTPEDPTVQVQRKQAGGFRGKKFSEGWVEFTKKSVAKKVANMLNGEQMGGKRRSSFFYDTWNIKYLSNFEWDDLTSELANKNRTREQKLALELSAAKRERDFYLRKVDQSRALNAMQERKKKRSIACTSGDRYRCRRFMDRHHHLVELL